MSFIEELGRHALLKLDAEKAHGLGIKALKKGLAGYRKNDQRSRLKVQLAGLAFPNPLGIAAGFDKNAEVAEALLKRGMGFAEIGTVTPRSQSGNPKPRIFRLEDHQAVINRLGFNNDGHDIIHARLIKRDPQTGIVGVNIGANKDSSDFVADYVLGIRRFYDAADYFTANISSPNTPGLRDLQAAEALRLLLSKIMDARAEMMEKNSRKIPVFLKIAPDISDDEISSIGEAVLDSGIDGLIISNTTIERAAVKGANNAEEAGGLSGRPVFTPSTLVLAKMRKVVGPDLPIIGVGGITDGKSALKKIKAGANLLQVYTGLIYRGFDLIDEIMIVLDQAVKSENASSITDLVSLETDEIIEASKTA